MKKLSILLLSVVLIACNNSPNQNNNSKKAESPVLKNTNDSTIVIAALNGGVPTFVVDTNTLKNDWEQFIINYTEFGACNITRVQIIMNEGGNAYYMVASGTINSSGDNIKSSVELELTPLPLTCLMMTSLTISCTTSACSSEQTGCMPYFNACTPCGNGGKCTKVVTDSPTTMFPSISPSTCQ